MNLNSIIEPIGKLLESAFETTLVPISDGFNWLVIVGGFVGLIVWLRMQMAYNKKAKNEGGLA
ncbi:MAG: hypothetical protein RL226_2218 [Bacteroidota bacterium]|jgi:hypothetical protein